MTLILCPLGIIVVLIPLQGYIHNRLIALVDNGLPRRMLKVTLMLYIQWLVSLSGLGGRLELYPMNIVFYLCQTIPHVTLIKISYSYSYSYNILNKKRNATLGLEVSQFTRFCNWYFWAVYFESAIFWQLFHVRINPTRILPFEQWTVTWHRGQSVQWPTPSIWESSSIRIAYRPKIG